MSSDAYVDEPSVVSFFIGELGWFLQRFQAYLRFLKKDVYPDRKFIIMMNQAYHVFVQDFIYFSIDLPDEFYALGLETDCYEAPLPGSPPGSLTPPKVWKQLVEYIRGFYNPKMAIEWWTPRGCNTWVDTRPQLFAEYVSDSKIDSDRPIICVYPRARGRANWRNVPEYVWRETVDRLREDFLVVLCGTPSGACLSDYEGENIVNLIKYDGEDKLERIITYMNNAVCSVGSQSGLTHVSLLSRCPSYIIGHEKERHAVNENRFRTSVSFRVVSDYRAIDAETICADIASFLDRLRKASSIAVPEESLNNTILSMLYEKDDVTGVAVADSHSIERVLGLPNINKLYAVSSKQNKVHSNKVLYVASLDEIEDELDFVYIDCGDRDWETIAGYIDSLYTKLKDGGIIAGNKFESEETRKAISVSLTGKRILQVQLDNSRKLEELSRREQSVPLIAGGKVNVNGKESDWIYRKKSVLRHSFSNLKDKKDLVGVEIGVYDGENARILLKNLDIKKLYLVDPYSRNVAGYTDKWAIERIKMFAGFEVREFLDKVVFIEKKSEEAVGDIDEKLDFVYVDGNHEYEYVKKDIELYYPKLKADGLMAGHDYENKDVERAVNEFAQSNSLKIVIAKDPEDHMTNEWWYSKELNEYDVVLSSSISALKNTIDMQYAR